MSREEVIRCDVEDCKGGKHVYPCGCGHDVCELCLMKMGNFTGCPICFNKAKMVRT